MIRDNKLLVLVFINTLIAFLVDFYLGYHEFWKLLLLTELPILGIIFLALKGQKWAYVMTLIYYFIRSFNFYFPDFYLMTKNGLNFEISINSLGVNVVSLIFFFLLLYDIQNKFKNKAANIIRVVISIFVVFIFILGMAIPKDSKYDKASYNNKLELKQDTTSVLDTDFFIDIPKDWQTAKNYKGTSLFAISPKRDSLDRFKENFNIQLFDINYDVYSSEIVGNKLFESGTNGIQYNVEVISKEFSQEFSDYYTIEYILSDSVTFVKAKMFCKVKGKKAYSIIYSDSKATFDETLKSYFYPIFRSFRTK